MTTSLPPVIGYIRVGAAAPGLSGEKQKRWIDEWAAATGHHITEWVEEIGVGHAGPAFERAVSRCQGKMIVAFAPSRISRDPTELQTWNARVHAASGRLGFVEGWPQPDSWEQAVAEWAAAVASDGAGAPHSVLYHRRLTGPSAGLNRQQQAGYKVTAVDGAELDRNPHGIDDEA